MTNIQRELNDLNSPLETFPFANTANKFKNKMKQSGENLILRDNISKLFHITIQYPWFKIIDYFDIT